MGGKEVRGSKHANGDRVFLMAALDQDAGTVLAQEAIGVKTNKIPHLPVLLDRPGNLDGKVITADALHTLAVQANANVPAAGTTSSRSRPTNAPCGTGSPPRAGPAGSRDTGPGERPTDAPAPGKPPSNLPRTG